jgi:hypothetical protein
MMRAASILAVAAALAAATLPASAQRVSGTIRIPGGARTAGGNLVVAQDSAGQDIARAVTAEDGRFALPLPRPGAVRVVVQRVGFDDLLILDRALAAGEVVTLDTLAGAAHRLLPPRGAMPPASCVGDPQGKLYVDLLLAEARKALLAMQLGLSRAGVVARWAATDHRIAANGRDTARFTLSRRSGSLLGAFGSPVLAELQRSGFVVSAGQDRIFRGLDVPALLSPWFAENYCFRAVESSHATLALHFEPRTRRRDYVDISGVLSFARSTLEPTAIEYLYLGLPADEDKRNAGGQIVFGRTAGGTWLVTDWSIRFPQIGLVELETFRSQDRARLLQTEVMGHEYIGGMTMAVLEGTRRIYSREWAGPPLAPEIRTVCHEAILAAPMGAARGRLTSDGRPVSGSRIRATWRVGVDVGTEAPLWREEARETMTSNRGEWVLCDLPSNTPVELSWEVLGRRSAAPLSVAAGQVVTVGPDGKIEP